MFLQILNILLAIVPALVLVIYFYKRDNQKKEPLVLIWKVFVLGFFSVIPAVLIELVLDSFTHSPVFLQNLLVKAFLTVALVEEGIKLAVIMLYLYRKPDFDEITDGIIYTIVASLGFACFENILYSTGGFWAVILRAVTAVPLHTVASGIMGYYIGVNKFCKKNSIIKGLIAAVIIHGLYDALLFTGTILAYLVIPLLVISWLILNSRIKRTQNLDHLTGLS